MRQLALATILAAVLTPAAHAQGLPLPEGVYVGADTGCADGHAGNTVEFSLFEDGYLLRWVTSYELLSGIAPTAETDVFEAVAVQGSTMPQSQGDPRPVRIELRGAEEFAMVEADGTVYPHLRRCGPLTG